MKWRKPKARCGESSQCPEVSWDGNEILIRNSANPSIVARFSYAEWVMIRNDPGFMTMKEG